jgi:hypothetical protein
MKVVYLIFIYIYIYVVAVTVCGNSGWTSHDDYNLMKFPYIKTNIGINNVTSTGYLPVIVQAFTK